MSTPNAPIRVMTHGNSLSVSTTGGVLYLDPGLFAPAPVPAEITGDRTFYIAPGTVTVSAKRDGIELYGQSVTGMAGVTTTIDPVASPVGLTGVGGAGTPSVIQGGTP